MSHRKTTSRYHVNHKAPAPKIMLSEDEQALADVYDEAVRLLREIADQTIAGDEPKDVSVLFAEFRDTAAKAIKMTHSGTSLTPIIAQHNTAGRVALAMIAEHTAIGIPAWSLNAEGVKVYSVPDESAFARISDLITEIESSDLSDRLHFFVDNADVAAIAVGALLGRNGLGDPFFVLPWTSESMGPSLFGAALVSAVLAQIPAVMGPNYYGLTDTTPDARAALTKAAGAAYDAINDYDQDDVIGHGTTSLVIEDILLGIDRDENFGERDLHRLSILLAISFIGGRDGETRPLKDDNTLCRAFFDAAAAIGRETAPNVAILSPNHVTVMPIPTVVLPN